MAVTGSASPDVLGDSQFISSYGPMVSKLLTCGNNTVSNTMAKLESTTSNNKKLFFKRKTSSPMYVFTTHDAVEWLQKRASFNKKEAMACINAFLDAHILHCPSNRPLLTHPTGNTELQPTAKGIFYLQEWFNSEPESSEKIGCSILEELFTSSYNSMQLVKLERSLLSRRLQISTGLVIILWNRLMGTEPQQYDANLGVTSVLSVSNTSALMNAESSQSHAKVQENRGLASPYYTRTMIHPNSCNLMQYWSSSGLRMFRNLRFEKPGKSKFASAEEYTVDFAISGHALLQWIMDCTSVENTREGMRLAGAIASCGLIEKIADSPVDALAAILVDNSNGMNAESAEFTTTSLYSITSRGFRLCNWDYSIDESWLKAEKIGTEARMISEEVRSKSSAVEQQSNWNWEHGVNDDVDRAFGRLLNFKVIQNDPGLKMLFREELMRFQCSETFSFIDTAQQLLLLISAAVDSKSTVTRRTHLECEARSLLDRTCKTYVEISAPYELNISEYDREALLSAAKHKNLAFAIHPLTMVKHQCVDLLRDAIVSFKTSHKTRDVPLLREYIVAKYNVEKEAGDEKKVGAHISLDNVVCQDTLST